MLLTVTPGTGPTAHHPSHAADPADRVASCAQGTARPFPELLGPFPPLAPGRQDVHPLPGGAGPLSCLCLYLSLSVSVSLSLSLPLRLSPSISLLSSDSLSLSLPPCLCFSVSVSLPLFLSLNLSAFLPLSPSVSLGYSRLQTGQRVADKHTRGRYAPSVRLHLTGLVGCLEEGASCLVTTFPPGSTGQGLDSRRETEELKV